MKNQQDKPTREERKAKELSDLKRENNQLKRQLERLRKRLNKMNISVIEEIDEEPVEVVEERVEEAGGCEKCGGEIKELELAGKKFIVCTVCNWRKKQ